MIESRSGTDVKHSLYCYNKVDAIGIEHMDNLAREPNTVVMSCELDLGVQDVVERCWDELRLIRIYTKRYVSISCVMMTKADNDIAGRESSPTLARP